MTKRAAVIGTFDGMHLGHIAVLHTLKREAEIRSMEPLAITFDRHPLMLIAPQRAPKAITTLQKKEELIRKEGITPVILPFDENLRATTAADWMKYLKSEYGVELLVVGYDTTFGCDGLSFSISDYRRIGEEIGMEVEEAPFVAGISSSDIRKAIAKGEISKATEMLGRHFSLPGTVVEGNKLGRTIGFPTANLMPAPGIVIPANGVYAAKATLPDGKKYDAMINIGVRPTIRRGNAQTIEANIIGWNGDLYGRNIRLSFYKRLRDEEQFKSIDALRKQLEIDRGNTVKALNEHPATL